MVFLKPHIHLYSHSSSVSAAIKIIKKIKDATSLLDGTVSFEMSLSHDDIPVHWMFKGAEVKPSDKCKILSERKAHKLVLQNVDSGNAGEYSAVIGHLQCSATLTVEGEEDLCTFIPPSLSP